MALRPLQWGVLGLLVCVIGLLIMMGITLIDERDVRDVPSPLIGRPLPSFDLPTLQQPDRTLGPTNFRGEVVLLNVWGSWCVSCRVEHPFLMQLASRNIVPIYGLNYKDERDQALAWLSRYGDPYRASAFDADGRVGIDLGVYGAPETYIVDADGTIVYKQIGPITEQIWQNDMLPLIKSLRGESL